MGRKLKHSTRDSTPTVLATVGVESSPAPWDDPDGRTGWIVDRVVVVVRRRTRRGWQTAREYVCPGWRDVWDVIDGLGASGRRVYVVAGRASDALTLLHWWGRVERGEVTLSRPGRSGDRGMSPGKARTPAKLHPLVMHGRPDVIGYQIGHASYTWVSVTNWCNLSIIDMAGQVGYPVPTRPDGGDKWEACRWPAEGQARVMMCYMVRLFDWWRANGCGTWRDTPGAAAWSSFLRRTDDSGIIRHDDADTLRLEDAACSGGRVSCWYFGDVGSVDGWPELADAPPPSGRGLGLAGPIHRLDCRSMYPSLLASEVYPVALLRRETRCSIPRLKTGLRSLLAVARVLIRTDVPHYPRRVNGLPQYPTGQFVATLTTPDLRRALAAGHVLRVGEVAWYTPGRPFRQWAEWVLGLRSAMRESGDKAGEAMVKLLSNSLSGRLARIRVGWADRPRMIPVKWWGDWWSIDRESGEYVQYRALAGRVQAMTRDTHRPGTLGACYAHLTAYGRVLMDQVRETAGKREVLWQDTDGVIVTDLGRERIEASHYYHPTANGKLRYEDTYHNARFLTPKHYWADGQWVLSGIHDGFVVKGGTHAEDVVTTNPARQAIDPRAAAVYRAVRSIDLRDIEPGVEVGGDGWAIPPAVKLADPGRTSRSGQLNMWEDQ